MAKDYLSSIKFNIATKNSCTEFKNNKRIKVVKSKEKTDFSATLEFQIKICGPARFAWMQ